MNGLLAIISILVIISLPCSIIAFLIFSWKTRKFVKQNDTNYEGSEVYAKLMKRKKNLRLLPFVLFLLYLFALA